MFDPYLKGYITGTATLTALVIGGVNIVTLLLTFALIAGGAFWAKIKP